MIQGVFKHMHTWILTHVFWSVPVPFSLRSNSEYLGLYSNSSPLSLQHENSHGWCTNKWMYPCSNNVPLCLLTKRAASPRAIVLWPLESSLDSHLWYLVISLTKRQVNISGLCISILPNKYRMTQAWPQVLNPTAWHFLCQTWPTSIMDHCAIPFPWVIFITVEHSPQALYLASWYGPLSNFSTLSII